MDTIANLIIKIKNANAAGHESVRLPHSNLRQSICEVLKKEGFISNFEKKSEKSKPVLSISLISENRHPKINGVKRLSKPSKRIYAKASEIRPVRNGYGALILSTSAGIMTGREAKKQKLGGETLFQIW